MARSRRRDPEPLPDAPLCEPAPFADDLQDLVEKPAPAEEPDVPAETPPWVPVLHKRAELNLPPVASGRLRGSEGVVLHCTDGHRPQTQAEGEALVRKIYRYHTAPVRMVERGGREVNAGGRGWRDAGYHWVVDPWGDCWALLGWGLVGRHAKTADPSLNLRSHGIVVLGDGQELTEPERQGVLWLVGEHDRRYGPGFVIGHRDVSSKACPGDAAYEVVQALGRPLA